MLSLLSSTDKEPLAVRHLITLRPIRAALLASLPACTILVTTALSSCSSDDADPPADAAPPADAGGAGDAKVDVDSGDPCSKVQSCAQACNADPATYDACVAACRATASNKALGLLEAYEDCAAAAMEGACEAKCAAGVTDEDCGDCVLAECIAQWNDCRVDT